jgi:hypothetical protein
MSFLLQYSSSLSCRVQDKPGGRLVYTEKRREDRSVFTRQPKGKLQILAGDRCIHVYAVKDMSPMGIRLETDAQVNIGGNVLIRYQAEGIDLKLNGTVVWNSDSSSSPEDVTKSGGYTVGIKLASPSLLHAFW